MSITSCVVVRSLVQAVLIGAFVAGRADAQVQQGAITGRVTDAITGQPIVSVQVNVIGTNVGTQVNSQGQYTLRGVTTGAVEVRVVRVGFAEQRRTVTVTAGETVALDFQMRAVAVELSPVVTTAIGDQRRLEVGNSIARIDAAQIVQTRAISNMGDLLTSRAAGVQVFGPTQIGAGTRVRIRGTSSLSLSNNPLYVVDGIRVEGTTGSSSVSVGGTLPARVNDLNPDEIESISVVRGPSAVPLYGTAGANGVIVVQTKRGIAGRPQFTYFTEQGGHVDRNTYPDAYRGWRTSTTAANNSTVSNTAQCFLTQVASGACKQDSVTSYNLYEDPESTPNGVGYRQLHGLQVRGGSEILRYFLHGEWENDDGILKVPEFDKRYLAAHFPNLRPLLPEEKTPNHMDRVTTRANFNLTLSPKADLALNMGFTSSDLRLPTSDDSGVAGVAGNTYGGPGFKYNVNAAGDTLYGWRQVTPRDVYQTVTNQAIKRLITSVSGNYLPFGWLSARGTFGLDYINRLDTQLCRFGSCPDLGGDSRLGFKIDNRTNFFTYSASGSASATRRFSDAIQSLTTVGVGFDRNIFDRNGTNGVQLAPGATTVTSGAVRTADEATEETRTLGAFIEEHVGFNDRLFVTAAVRSDRNSAFGRNFKTVFYPKLALSWVAALEPTAYWLNQLRLRSAYGASGVQPGTTDAVPFYSGTRTRGESADLSAAVFTALGNPNLKPERSTEFELGLDGIFWNNRLSSEITYYRKTSKDALISRGLAPSLGTGATVRFENLGEVRNSGWEALITAQLIQHSALGWDVTINGATNDNKIVSLGGLPSFGGATQQQREGYPLNGWWARRLTGYSDANGDGLIALSEITVSDTAEFLGYPLPKHEVSLTNGFDFWQRRLRLSAMFDYRGGHTTYNNTERIRCASRNNCSGLINPGASLFEQARTVMVRESASRSVSGFFEDGDFIRFRELSLSFNAPEGWSGRFLGTRRVTATLSARNLGILWTDYTGVDPEAFATTGDAPSEFQAFPPPTYYAIRLSLGY